MSDTIKSVFRQERYEYIYDFVTFQIQNPSGEIIETGTINTNVKFISDDELCQCNVKMPMLEVGEKFFLSGINKTITIKIRMRSSDGSVVYYAENLYEKTENSELTLEKAKTKRDAYEGLSKRVSQLEQELDECKNSRKNRHRFFDFKR